MFRFLIWAMNGVYQVFWVRSVKAFTAAVIWSEVTAATGEIEGEQVLALAEEVFVVAVEVEEFVVVVDDELELGVVVVVVEPEEEIVIV